MTREQQLQALDAQLKRQGTALAGMWRTSAHLLGKGVAGDKYDPAAVESRYRRMISSD